MFYPVDSLKRGGRFYLCWIADSWPLQFEKLTHRNQRLWSQDIREICEHLRELMMSESGRPSHRFSLRLSSQLMRGLTRIYQKKVELFIRDVWRINNDVVQRNRPHEPSGRPGGHRRRTVAAAVDRPRLVIEEMPEEVNVERIMENATNQVARVEDITLRELTLPEVRLVDDGFGELNLQEPVEVMLAQEVSVMQHSALELPADVSDAHDKCRLAPHDAAQMEPISEHDMSLFRKSAGEAPTLGDFEKELPDMSEIPPPELPAPEPQNQAIEPQVELPRAGPSEGRVQRSEAEIVLDPLEDLAGEPRRKRRRLDKLIVDRSTQLDSDYYRVRIANDDVELRCETAKEDVIQLRTPAVTLLSRPARSGAKPVSRFSSKLGDIFIDRLAGLIRKSTAESDLEEQRVRRATTVPVQETIQEMQVETVVQEPTNRTLQEPIQEMLVETVVQEPANRTLQEPIQEMQVETIVQEPASKTVQEPELQEQVLQDITNVHVAAAPAEKDIDISMLPTQKILTVSQENRNYEKSIDKRSLSQRQRVTRSSARAADKENIPVEINIQGTENMEVMPPQSTQEHDLNIMLQQAGLADVVQEPVTPRPPDVEPRTSEAQRAREGRSSETPLGSLDRTKVSLGDTDKTTDSQRFINEEWGTRGTMFKIFRCALVGVPNITVELLVRRGPVLEGCRRRIAARCFTSILKLSSQGFIKIIKDADTNEIKHIELGPRIPLPGRN